MELVTLLVLIKPQAREQYTGISPHHELDGIFAIGMTLASFQRSRSEAGSDYCMDTNLRARLLHLDVRALSMLGVEGAISQAQDVSQHLQIYS
jgi:hypothetical protein